MKEDNSVIVIRTVDQNETEFHEACDESDSESESFQDALEQMSLNADKEKTEKSREESAPMPDEGEAEDEANSESELDAEDIELSLKERDEKLSAEQLEELHQEALQIKLEANEKFKAGEYEVAIEKYSEALLTCPLCHPKDRSVLYSNRAASHMRMENYEVSIKDCSKAVELNPQYVKALLRRAELYEKTEKLDEALEDYQKLVNIDPSLTVARQACMRLPDQIKERNEKMKEEMMGKLKDLGNLVLRPFGLSTDNFNLQQDPNTGGYSVQFQQTPSNGK